MFEYVYGLIYTFIYVLVLSTFAGTIMKGQKKKTAWAFIIFGWAIVQFGTSVLLDQYVVFKQLAVIFVNWIILYLFYERKLVKSLFAAFIYQAMALLCDYVSMMFLMRINRNISSNNINSSFQGFLASLVSLIVLLSIVFMIKRITSREEEVISEDTWIKLCIMPVISIVCIVAMFVNFGGDITGYQKNTVLVLAVVFILVNLYVYQLVYEVSRGKAIESRNEILSERNNQIYARYTETMEQYKNIRRREHEYKNILLALYAIAKKEDCGDIIHTIESEVNMSEEREYKFDTNNPVTNLIFNHMFQQAEDKQILLSYKFNDLSGIPMSEKDIAILYSNIINNAIEACEKLEEKKRIYISSHCENSNFIIKAENRFNGEIKKSNGRYISTKKNVNGHGYGVEAIKEIVEKYDGTFVDEVVGDIFRIIIVVPIKKKEGDDF